MPERICPNCGERLTVGPTAVPLAIRCPACEGSFTQRPDIKPRRKLPAAVEGAPADRPDAAGPPAPRGLRLSASWRDFRPSLSFLLTLAVIAVGVIASQVAFRAWRAGRPGPTAEVAAPADSPSTDQPDGLPADVPGTDIGQPDRWDLAAAFAVAADAVRAAAAPAVVRVVATDAQGRLVGEGGGVVVAADGLVLTNFHTVRLAAAAEVVLSDGTRLPVTGVADVGPAGDLALLAVDAQGLAALPVGEPTFPDKGSAVYVLSPGDGEPAATVSTFVKLVKPNGSVVAMELDAPLGLDIAGAVVLADEHTLIAIGSEYFSARMGFPVAVPARVTLPPAGGGDVLTLIEAGTRLSLQQSQALRAARGAMAGGDYGLARDILGAMSALADRKPAVWMARGDVHSYQGDFAAAADAYERAVDLQSESAGLFRQLGEARRRLKRPVRAIDAFRRAIALDDGDAGSHFGLGDVYLSQGLHAAAIAELTAAIDLDDSHELYRYTLGSAYYADKQYTQAVQAFRDALQLAPDQPLNAYALGNCHYALGQYARAKDAYQMAVNLAPDEPLYHYVLGNACYRLGETAHAISAYERYIDLEPGTTRSDQARDLVAKLRSRSDEP